MTSHSSEGSGQANGRRFGALIRPRFFILVLLLVAVAVFAGANQVRSSTIPTISISSVVTDQTVTIQTYNFPANQNFVVTMGPFGSKGINGIPVATTNSGVGGSFSVTSVSYTHLDVYKRQGVKTNIPFHQHMMDSHRFLSGQFDTKFVEDRFSMDDRDTAHALEAALLATLAAHEQNQRAAQLVAPGARDTSNWKWYSRWERLRR